VPDRVLAALRAADTDNLTTANSQNNRYGTQQTQLDNKQLIPIRGQNGRIGCVIAHIENQAAYIDPGTGRPGINYVLRVDRVVVLGNDGTLQEVRSALTENNARQIEFVRATNGTITLRPDALQSLTNDVNRGTLVTPQQQTRPAPVVTSAQAPVAVQPAPQRPMVELLQEQARLIGEVQRLKAAGNSPADLNNLQTALQQAQAVNGQIRARIEAAERAPVGPVTPAQEQDRAIARQSRPLYEETQRRLEAEARELAARRATQSPSQAQGNDGLGGLLSRFLAVISAIMEGHPERIQGIMNPPAVAPAPAPVAVQPGAQPPETEQQSRARLDMEIAVAQQRAGNTPTSEFPPERRSLLERYETAVRTETAAGGMTESTSA
jgi:hypothetical protein